MITPENLSLLKNLKNNYEKENKLQLLMKMKNVSSLLGLVNKEDKSNMVIDNSKVETIEKNIEAIKTIKNILRLKFQENQTKERPINLSLMSLLAQKRESESKEINIPKIEEENTPKIKNSTVTMTNISDEDFLDENFNKLSMSSLVSKIRSNPIHNNKVLEKCKEISLSNLRMLYWKLNTLIGKLPEREEKLLNDFINENGLDLKNAISCFPFVDRHTLRKYFMRFIIMKCLTDKVIDSSPNATRQNTPSTGITFMKLNEKKIDKETKPNLKSEKSFKENENSEISLKLKKNKIIIDEKHEESDLSSVNSNDFEDDESVQELIHKDYEERSVQNTKSSYSLENGNIRKSAKTKLSETTFADEPSEIDEEEFKLNSSTNYNMNMPKLNTKSIIKNEEENESKPNDAKLGNLLSNLIKLKQKKGEDKTGNNSEETKETILQIQKVVAEIKQKLAYKQEKLKETEKETTQTINHSTSHTNNDTEKRNKNLLNLLLSSNNTHSSETKALTPSGFYSKKTKPLHPEILEMLNKSKFYKKDNILEYLNEDKQKEGNFFMDNFYWKTQKGNRVSIDFFKENKQNKAINYETKEKLSSKKRYDYIEYLNFLNGMQKEEENKKKEIGLNEILSTPNTFISSKYPPADEKVSTVFRIPISPNLATPNLMTQDSPQEKSSFIAFKKLNQRSNLTTTLQENGSVQNGQNKILEENVQNNKEKIIINTNIETNKKEPVKEISKLNSNIDLVLNYFNKLKEDSENNEKNKYDSEIIHKAIQLISKKD